MAQTIQEIDERCSGPADVSNKGTMVPADQSQAIQRRGKITSTFFLSTTGWPRTSFQCCIQTVRPQGRNFVECVSIYMPACVRVSTRARLCVCVCARAFVYACASFWEGSRATDNLTIENRSGDSKTKVDAYQVVYQ